MQTAITPEEARLAGFNPEDVQSMKNLERQLAEWDYTATKSAKIAYSSKSSIERLQLLRQIKYLTCNNKLIELRKRSKINGHNNIGPSMLYDALANSKAPSKSKWIFVRGAVRDDGGKLQEGWDDLESSTAITNFVNKYQSYLEGSIGSDKKWHPSPRQIMTSLSPAQHQSDDLENKPDEKYFIEHSFDKDNVEYEREQVPLQAPQGNDEPNTTQYTISRHQRVQDVKEWIKNKAKGKCECCDEDAPFRTPDGSPYLEPHHVIALGDGGPDTIENVIAACPNCHRELHYGAGRDALRESLYKKISRLIR